MGPNELDCPMWIMNQLGEYPPAGEYSARWRERVLQHHQEETDLRLPRPGQWNPQTPPGGDDRR